MKKFVLVGEPDDGILMEIPESCDFKPRLVNCQSRSNCEYYLQSEGEVKCPLGILKGQTQILIKKEE